MSIKSVVSAKTSGPEPLLRRRGFDPIVVSEVKLVFVEIERRYCLDSNRHVKKGDKKGFIYDQEFRICGSPDLVQKTIKGTKELQLHKLKGKTTETEFTFSGKFVEAEIKRVIDADTLILSFYIDNTNYCWSCRILGIDAKEKKTELGDKVAAKIRAMLTGIKKVYAILGELDKFSRILTVLYLDKDRKINLNKRIFEENRGSICEYWGDKKEDAWAFDASDPK